MKIIEHAGQTLKTKHWEEITSEKYNELKNQFYELPSYEKVKREFDNIHNRNGVKISDITSYYVKDIMAQAKMYHSKWSIADVWDSKELVEYFYAKSKINEKVCPKDKSDIDNIKTIMRLGGKGVASKVSNFPLKTVRQVLQDFNLNGNYYDFSCGWGVRLLGALSEGLNYYGTDPNHDLTRRLNMLYNDYSKVNNVHTHCDIRTQGSELFIPEWENTIGVAFSSPPYFFLEDYKIGNQSATAETTYNEWLNDYFIPTFMNVKKYLINGGYLLININDYDKYELVKDTKQIVTNIGFKYVDTLNLKNIQRTNSNGGFNDNSEGILVFQKER